jgi:hypothetical protein
MDCSSNLKLMQGIPTGYEATYDFGVQGLDKVKASNTWEE